MIPENLFGKSILIGRDPQSSRLLVGVSINGIWKAAMFGSPLSVPPTVSRCVPKENVGHCQIDVQADGSMIIHNMKPQNTTYVDGQMILSKAVYENSVVELGMDRYRLSMVDVFGAASKAVGDVKPPAKTFALDGLKKEWDRHHNVLMTLKKKQKNTQLWSRLPIFFTMGGGAITGAAKFMEADDKVVIVSLGLTIVGFIIMVYGIIRSLADKSIEKTEEENKLFMQRYVCPNPDCGAFKGNTDFEALKKVKRCPNCGCNYTVKQG